MASLKSLVMNQALQDKLNSLHIFPIPHVNPWLIHIKVWQKPLQYCKVISLQLIKINGKKNLIVYQVLVTCIYILVETFARQRWLFSFSMNGFVT